MRYSTILAAILFALGAGQASPTLDEVLARVSQFAEQQRETLSNVRADEEYVQWLQTDSQTFQRRTLQSEIAFVRLTGQADWVAFRNVVHVDRKPTGADPARLEKLFREGDVAGQGERLVRESATYNIGGLQRNLNTPTIAMHLLMPGQIGRFRFKQESEVSEPGGDIWVVSFKETERPTIVRSPSRRDDVPIHGRLWIAPRTGVLRRAILEMDYPVKSRLEFVWRRDENIDEWVPSEMHERYASVRGGTALRRPYDIRGTARYTNYRRFAVDFRIK